MPWAVYAGWAITAVCVAVALLQVLISVILESPPERRRERGLRDLAYYISEAQSVERHPQAKPSPQTGARDYYLQPCLRKRAI